MAVAGLKSWWDAVPSKDDLWEKTKCVACTELKTGVVAGATYAVLTEVIDAALDKSKYAFSAKRVAKSSLVGTALAVSLWFTVSVIQETRLRKMAASSVGDQTMVLFMPKYDGLFDAGTHRYFAQSPYDWTIPAAQGKKLVFQRVETPEEIVSTLNKLENIQTVLMVFHGSREDGISFSRFHRSGSDSSFFAEMERHRFAEGAQVVLASCKLGEKSKHYPFSFADLAQFLLGPKIQVVAADGLMTHVKTTPLEDGTTRFEICDGDHCTTVRPDYKTVLETAKSFHAAERA